MYKVFKLEIKGLSMIQESLRGLMEKGLALGGSLVLDSENSAHQHHEFSKSVLSLSFQTPKQGDNASLCDQRI